MNIDELEISVSLNDKFGYINHFTTLMKVEDFLQYKGDLKLYAAQFPLYKKMRIEDLYNETDFKVSKSKMISISSKFNAKSKALLFQNLKF